MREGTWVVSVYQNSSDGIAMGCGLGDLGSILGWGKKFLSSLYCPDQLWDPPSLFFNGYQGLLHSG
jgi:hypothetical protein